MHGLDVRLERDSQELEAQRDEELELIKLRFKKNKRVVDNELGVLESRTRNLLEKHNFDPSQYFGNINNESVQARPFIPPISPSHHESSEPPLPELPASSLLFGTPSPTASTMTKRAITSSPLNLDRNTSPFLRTSSTDFKRRK